MIRRKWYNSTKEQSRNLLVFGYNRENYIDRIPNDVSYLIASFYQALPIWDFSEEMHKFNKQTSSWFSDLFYKIGTFNALTGYNNNDKNNYSAMLKRVESQIEIGNNHSKSIKTLINDSNDINDTNNTNDIKLTELQNHSNSLISTFTKIASELQEAQIYIHPDHKKIELLQTQIKELQLSEPYIDSLSLAALSTIPPFLKHELDKFHLRLSKIRTKQQEKELDEKDETQRQSNFNDTLSKVQHLLKNIKEKQDIIKNKLKVNFQNVEKDPTAFFQDVQQIRIACDQIAEYAESLDDEFYWAREYIHPSQAALIQITNKYNKMKIDLEETKRLLSMKNAELFAYKSQNAELLIEICKESQLKDLQIVQKTNDILIELRNKSDSISNSLPNGKLDDVMKMIDDMEEQLVFIKDTINPTATYVSILEERYVEMTALYKMKFSEIEHQKDLLYESQQEINDLKQKMSDLDYRLGAVMSSGVSNVETRMKAFNEMGIKTQTIQKVIKLIDDTYSNIQQACQDIQESVDKDLSEIIGDSFNDKQWQDTAGMMGNVAHACDYILGAFIDIGGEMDGVQQFVHPDREMVEQLQCELIAMYEQQEKEQQEKKKQEMEQQEKEEPAAEISKQKEANLLGERAQT